MRNQLEEIRTWAKDKLAAGAEPPWSFYQHMKLVEAVDEILKGMDATENSGRQLRVVSDADKGTPTQLPI